MADETSAERRATNEVAFREANDRIEARARSSSIAHHVPFLCECADPACTETVRLDLDEYRRIRAEARWFLTTPGHEQRSGATSQVVEQHGDYTVVVKKGVEGAIAIGLVTEVADE